MIHIKGTVQGVPQTISALQQLPSLLRQAGMRAMTDSLHLLSKTVRDDYLQGPFPTEIERRSGSFRTTFARGHADNIWIVQAQGTQILGTFGSKDKRARILNDGTAHLPGGVLKSTRPGGYLAIRSQFTMTGRGVVREKYRQPLRNLPNTFVRPIRSRRATAAVFEKIGKRIVPIAWLVKSVVIVGRHFIEKTEQKAGPGVQAIFQQQFDTITTRVQQTLAKIRG